MQSFLEIAKQNVILFGFIAVGAAAYRLKLWGRQGVSQITTLVLYFVIPMLTIESMQVPFETKLLKGALIAAIFSVLTHAIAIAAARFILPNEPDRAKRVYSFAVVIENTAFFGLPLISLTVGVEGIFYAAIYIMVFHLFTWTYGVSILKKGQRDEPWSVRHALLSPGVISVAVAFLLFLLPFRLPDVMLTAVRHIASLNRPLGMMIVGAEIAAVSLGKFWRDRQLYIATGLRLVLLPLLFLPLILLLTRDRALAFGAYIPAIVPTAANIMMFTARFEQDTLSASRALTVTTMAGLITVPFWIFLLDTFLPV